MSIGGPDWRRIRNETWRGIARFWPLLLVVAAAEMAIVVGTGAMVGEAAALEPGRAGFIAYLKLAALEFVPYGVTYVVSAAVVLNGLSEQPVGRAAILGRAMRALPAELVGSAIVLAPYWASGLITYGNVDTTTWWLARAGALVGSVALATAFGFIGLEAIARGLAPMAAVRASAALTRGQRTWLAWVFLGLEVLYEVIRQVGYPIDDRLWQGGFTALGMSPLTGGVLALLGVVVLPLAVAIYLELRRLQAGELPGIGATFD